MKRSSKFLLWTIVVCSCLLLMIACSDSDDDITDGDQNPDGDISDGDMETDGDAADGDMEGEGEETSQYPDPEFIHEVRTSSVALPDASFAQEFPDRYRSADRLADLQISAMVAQNGQIFVGTPTGVYFKGAGSASFEAAFAAWSLPAAAAPVTAMAKQLYQGKVAVGFDDRVDLLSSTNAQDETLAFTPGGLLQLASNGAMLAAATATGIYVYSTNFGDTDWHAVTLDPQPVVKALAIDAQDTLLLATDAGLLEVSYDHTLDQATLQTTWTAANGDLLDDDVRDIAICGDRLVIASATSIAIKQGDTVKLYKAEVDGLPMDNNLSVTCNDEAILLGHEIGATYIEGNLAHIDYYQSKRWMENNRVSSVALGENGDRWVAGEAGVSRIYLVTRTLADKEKVFDGYVDAFWRMDGFVSSDGRLPEPYSDFSQMWLGDKDNDGLWTQMMIGGWCMAYAATGEEKYYQYARKAMDNMLLEIDVPAIDFEANGMKRGFITRSLVRDDEGDVYTSKETRSNWHPVTYEGRDYYWKDDTSSDEIVGHFFGFPMFYDLCAKDDAEREQISKYAIELAEYIIDGGYVLIDLDGERTMHGHWNPETLSICIDGFDVCIENGYSMDECLDACTSGNFGGGWLNSLEILGHMLAAYHMSGEKKFYDAYEYLINEHRYNELAMANENTWTITRPSIANHSDHELAILAYTTLIRYEARDDRRAEWIESLKFMYDYERPERNPWWAGVYALSGGGDDVDSQGALRTLQEIPDDIREWYIDNRSRKDMVQIENDRHGDAQCDRVFPFDEIRTMWWNGNPYDLESGGDGTGLQAPTAWLLPYYMGLYTGLIQSDK